jgi:hypothetical protein
MYTGEPMNPLGIMGGNKQSQDYSWLGFSDTPVKNGVSPQNPFIIDDDEDDGWVMG